MAEATTPLNGAHLDAQGSVSRSIREIFLEQLHVDVPSDDADLLQNGLLDSLGLVELLLSIEQKFRVSILLEDIEIEHLRSIRSIAVLIVGLLGG